MREDELKRIVEDVVRTLASRGYLKEGECGCKPATGVSYRPFSEGSSRVTVGTAGKVFSDEWRGTSLSAKKLSAAACGGAPAAPADAKTASSGEHTGGGACPQCESASRLQQSHLKALGVDRLAVCSPTKKGSCVTDYVDHTLLKPNATEEEVAKLCEEAKEFCFASVCINPSYVAFCAKLLAGSGVKVCTVVGFPLGSTTSMVKVVEARDAMANGADEIDMVINVGALKSGNDATVYDDIRAVRDATRGKVLKVILETALLTKEEKVRACVMAKKAGADFVKTSTGFGGGGATAEDIRLMRETVGPLMGVKASGGIRDAKAAEAMIAAGATRLGTSASVAIVTDASPSGGAKGY